MRARAESESESWTKTRHFTEGAENSLIYWPRIFTRITPLTTIAYQFQIVPSILIVSNQFV